MDPELRCGTLMEHDFPTSTFALVYEDVFLFVCSLMNSALTLIDSSFNESIKGRTHEEPAGLEV